MRYAPIAAPQWARHYQKGDYHMVIAPWVLESPGLAQYYGSAQRDDRTLVMMDNGSWEGFDLGNRDLIRAGTVIAADEVVLPDVLHEPKETLLASRQAYLLFAETTWPLLPGAFQIRPNLEKEASVDFRMGPRSVMFVPQGRTADIWRRCRDLWLGWWAKEDRACGLCIGINSPRAPEITRRRSALIEETAELGLQVGYQVHLLGIPDVREFIHAELPLAHAKGVRGVDSSLPFALGAEDYLLRPASEKIPLRSPEEYARLGTRSRRMISLNIAILRDWVEAGSHTWYVPWHLIYKVALAHSPQDMHPRIYEDPALALRQAGFPNGTYQNDGTAVMQVIPAPTQEPPEGKTYIEVR